MRSFRVLLAGLLAILVAGGCGGSSMIKARGRILQGGKPYPLEAGEGWRIYFSPQSPSKDGKFDSYAAAYFPGTETFEVHGKDGKGMPPGTYHVNLQLMKKKEDLFKGRLIGLKSPFTCEVSNGSQEIIIDLDQVQDPVKTTPKPTAPERKTVKAQS